MANYWVEHSVDILILVVAAVILLWAVDRYCPSLPQFIRNFMSVIAKEFWPRKDKLVAEKLNALYVLIITILSIILGFICMPSAIASVFGGAEDNYGAWIFLAAILALIVTVFTSFNWINRYNKQKIITDKVRRTLRTTS